MNPNNRLGRKTALTPELVDTFVKCLLGACTIKTACQVVGIARGTFSLWQRTAKQAWEVEAEDRTPYQDKCCNFMTAIMEAEGRIKRNLLAVSVNSARTDPRMALRMLAQRWPDEYSPTRNVNVNIGGIGGGGGTGVVMDPREKLRAILGEPGVLHDAEVLAHAEIQKRLVESGKHNGNGTNGHTNGNGNGNGNGSLTTV